MSRRLVLRVPNPNAASARRPTPEDDPEAVSSENDVMDVDEAGEGEEGGEEVADEGEEEEEGAEDEEGEIQAQEEGEGEGDAQEEVDVEGGEDGGDGEVGGEDGQNNSHVRGRGRGRGRPRGATAGTPKPRMRGRGRPRGRPRGSGRGRGPTRARDASPVNLPEGYTGPKPYRFVNGQALFMKGDELTTEDDPKGDEKIDFQGNLLGGREFKAPTFSSPWRDDPERQYMLSIDAARTSGFRDSLYYFRRNPQLAKLALSQAEKENLIEMGRLPNSLKSRSVTLVTARSAYKVHGAKMIKHGRWVVDDYYESRSLAEGRTPGELVGEISQEPADAEPLHHAAAAPTTSATDKVYRVGGPSTLYGGPGDDTGPSIEIRLAAVLAADRELVRMRRAATSPAVTPHAPVAQASAGAGVPGGIPTGTGGPSVTVTTEPLDGDSTRLERRSEVADEPFKGEPPLGWYEPHTGVWHYRSDTQPTRAKLTHAPPTREAILADGVLGGSKVGSNAWGIASVKTFMELPEPKEKPPGEFIWEG